MSKQRLGAGLGPAAKATSGARDPTGPRLARGGGEGPLFGKEVGRGPHPPREEAMLVRAETQQPLKVGAVDVEAFSRNVARLVEEGGRALAAYLKPREEGRTDREVADEVADVVKTLGQVFEYWLADPQRAVELQTRL